MVEMFLLIEKLFENFIDQILAILNKLGSIPIVVVHGGGPRISKRII